jgi:hypothetical protein
LRDTTSRESLDEVVVTATRTLRSVKNVPVPVTVIGAALKIFGASFFLLRKPFYRLYNGIPGQV